MADPTQIPQPEGKRRTSWRHWALGIAAVLLVIFIALNSQQVKVNFIFGETKTPLVFALVIATLLGAVIGWAGPRLRRREHQQGPPKPG